jgi:hypothetical protein
MSSSLSSARGSGSSVKIRNIFVGAAKPFGLIGAGDINPFAGFVRTVERV